MRQSAKAVLFAGAALLATLPTWKSAEAAYAFASNQISGLAVQYVNPVTGVTSPITPFGIPTTSVNDTATYNGTTTGFSAPGIVGSSLDITQATVGTGPFPAENTFTPTAGIVGSRSDASITAGIAGTVGVNNVAETGSPSGSSNTGNAQSGNDATISFQVTGTGLAVQVSFSNLYQLIASSVLGETATAAIANSFRVVGAGVNFTAAPGAINTSVGSANGGPSTDSVGPTTTAFTIVSTPVLTAGQQYTITLQSQARTSIFGIAQNVPEPVSLGLLGVALVGLGMVRRRSSEA